MPQSRIGPGRVLEVELLVVIAMVLVNAIFAAYEIGAGVDIGIAAAHY